MDDFFEPGGIIVNGDEVLSGIFGELDSVMNLFFVEVDFDVKLRVSAVVFLDLSLEIVNGVLFELIVIQEVGKEGQEA